MIKIDLRIKIEVAEIESWVDFVLKITTINPISQNSVKKELIEDSKFA